MKTKTMGYNSNTHLGNWIIPGAGGLVGLFKSVHAQMLEIHLQPDLSSLLLHILLTTAMGGAGAWLGKELIRLVWKHLVLPAWRRVVAWLRRKPKNP